MFKIQDQERARLVNDVHDSFGGYITALKINLMNDPSDEKNINQIMDAFSKDYRVLLNSLYAPNITADNFKHSILEYCYKMQELTQIKISPIVQLQNILLPESTCMNIYKITSELVTNAIKHAKTENINVYIMVLKNTLQLVVSDHGKGFEKNKVRNNSFGLKSVEKRSLFLNGTFDIKSSKKKGSTITINIPIHGTKSI